MNQLITITPSWQLYIPKTIREKIGLKKPDRFKVEVKDKKIILTPQKSGVLELAGSLKKYNKENINIDKIREKIDYSKW